MSERIRIGDQWYVAATTARAEETPQVVKSGDTFALFDRHGDVGAWASGEQGLYHEDTRFLSHLDLTLNGARPMFLVATVKEGNNVLIVELMNPDLMEGDRVVVPKGEVHIFRAKLLWDGACYEHVRLGHHGMEPVRLQMSLRFEADFVDLFEVRGAQRTRRGERLPPQARGDELLFAYRGVDGRSRSSRVRLSPAPSAWGDREARFDIELQPHQDFHLYCTVACESEGDARGGTTDYETAYHRNGEARARQQSGQCRIDTSNPLMDLWLDRSASDLAMLTSELPTGPYPYAGVPWYSTTFGRYYGTVDATPLFVALAGAYWRRTGDLEFSRRLWPHVLAALDWIDRYGDRDGDGFVE